VKPEIVVCGGKGKELQNVHVVIDAQGSARNVFYSGFK